MAGDKGISVVVRCVEVESVIISLFSSLRNRLSSGKFATSLLLLNSSHSNLSKYLQFILTPVNHWSRRGLFDGDKALWGSWAVIGADGVSKFWHGGDTAYCDAFNQIGKVLDTKFLQLRRLFSLCVVRILITYNFDLK